MAGQWTSYLGPNQSSRSQSFFRKAILHQGQPPETITLDRYPASHRAVREMNADGLLLEDMKVRSSKYLNNIWLSRPIETSSRERT
uniref:DDE-type integrase/transposase/recombinase n=1 Tax=Robbsia andropogonis TaxID=28092 RepID=UPI0036F23867